MAGMGYRFLNKGYKIYKPFLKCYNKKSIIENIINNFEKNSNKYFIVNKEIKKKYINNLRLISNSKIIFIDKNKLGPGYTLLKAKKKIGYLTNVFVSYSDIQWQWNKKLNFKNKNIVFCYKGWHPYTKNSNNYAFCKIKKKKFNKLKEKSSFTNKWQLEPLSIGLFYYKNTNKLFYSLEKLLENKIKTNKEYFPSEGFNFLKQETDIKYVKNFAHIGTPEYYEEYLNKAEFFSIRANFKKKIKNFKLADKILIPAGGKSIRFKNEGIHVPKHFYFIKDIKERLIDYISQYLPKKNKILITYKNSIPKIINKKNFKFFYIKKRSKGQAETISEYLNKLKKDETFFVNSCDVFSTFNLKKYLKLKESSDIIIFVSSKSFVDLPVNAYSWVEIHNNILKNIYIKKKPKNNLKIITGNFFFKNKDIYLNFYSKLKNKNKKELYIDDLISEAIKLNYKVKAMEDDIYINLGTPELIKDYIFWKKVFKK